ncbi:hypothetical protein [Parasphingorhabdus cellanae]|uniref:Uncharacterized protein n=1 Tax=Parasphingorhabdus cellanae TaxID=2806553 RepID=A0ABX7SZW7_9SPHN|nr:hypothetical protein [Parasphingorhabdus cellanae]QTD54834.1 hypothetical protein J4G78_11280 [Parasphingorhabdus cellanae]
MLKDVSVGGGLKDLFTMLRRSPKEQAMPALLAFACSGFIFFLFIIDPKINTDVYVPQEVVYVENWSLERSDEEIMRDRWAVQCLKDKRDAKRRDAMKSLGRMSGMDVEEIERQAEADRVARGEIEVERPADVTC